MKKFLKVIKYTFISLISVVFAFFLYFFISNRLFLESENEENIAYLKNNNACVGDTLDESFFDADFYQSKVFLLGEVHGFADNQKLDKELLFFLNKKLGVKYYIA